MAESDRHKLETQYCTFRIFCGPYSHIKEYSVEYDLPGKEEVHERFQHETMSPLLPGPYFISLMDGRLMPAYRVYEDAYETFIQVRIKRPKSDKDRKTIHIYLHTEHVFHSQRHESATLNSHRKVQPTQCCRALEISKSTQDFGAASGGATFLRKRYFSHQGFRNAKSRKSSMGQPQGSTMSREPTESGDKPSRTTCRGNR